MVLGVAVGDAFGAGIEFQDYEFIQQHVLSTNYRFVNVLGDADSNFGRKFTAGNYTDDTEMTIGLMKAMLSVPKRELHTIDANAMIKYWVDEYHAAQWHSFRAWAWKRFGMGRNGHGMFEEYVQGRKSLSQIQRDKGL